MVLIFDISCLLCALIWPAALAYYSTITTSTILSIGDIAFENNWYNYFPLEHRKYTLFMIMRCQRPIYFTGLSVIYCTLTNFGSVIFFTRSTKFSNVLIFHLAIFSSSKQVAATILCSEQSRFRSKWERLISYYHGKCLRFDRFFEKNAF